MHFLGFTHMCLVDMNLNWKKGSSPVVIFARRQRKLFLIALFLVIVQREKINLLQRHHCYVEF